MSNKTLPERFEEFSEARRQGFVDVMNIKNEGGLIAGVFCAYTPCEILDAAGITSVGLCGTSEETIADAEKVLPRNLCPLIKSSYGFALTEKCPYFYFSDIIIGETTCDGKKKMYELLEDMGKRVYIMHLPQGADRDYEIDFWAKEIERLIIYLEDTFSVEITKEKLLDAVIKNNEYRRLSEKMFSMQKLVPPPMNGMDMIYAQEGEAYKFDRTERYRAMEELVEHIESDYNNGARPVAANRKRIMITGCPLGGAMDKIGNAIERNGGVIVCYDTCGGTRSSGLLVDESKNTSREEVIHAIADRYMKVGCSVLTPNTTRLENLPNLLEEYKIDGVVEVILQACHTYNVEAVRIKKIVKDQGVRYMSIETDYSNSDEGQIETRIQAFLEML